MQSRRNTIAVSLVGLFLATSAHAQAVPPQPAATAAPAAAQDNAPPRPRAIVGGQAAKNEDYPFMVQIGYKRRDAGKKAPVDHLCGGSFVSDRLILTAAHCFTTSDYHRKTHDIYVHVGDVETRRALQIKIERLPILHPDWRGEFHDIAVLVLPANRVRDVKARKVTPVRLMSVSGEADVAPLVEVTGWGKTDGEDVSRVLRFVNLSIRDRETCKKNWQDDFRRRNANWRPTPQMPEPPSIVNDSVICAADPNQDSSSKDSCNGDSGGPLLFEGIQIGIVAGGGAECGKAGLFGVYTRVTTYLPWIAEMKAAFK